MRELNGRIDDDIEIIYWGDEDTNDIVNSNKFSSRRKKREKFDLKKEILSWVKIVIIAVVVAFAINNVIIINATVPTCSMEATINKGNRMIGFRLEYVFSSPKRGDIIIFKYPDNENENYVKRVVGLPEETIEIREGIVYITDKSGENTIKLKEDYVYLDNGKYEIRGDFPKTKIPKGCYFVLGDNRNNSKDSRFWKTTHFVKESQILGKAMFVYYPSFKKLT